MKAYLAARYSRKKEIKSLIKMIGTTKRKFIMVDPIFSRHTPEGVGQMIIKIKTDPLIRGTKFYNLIADYRNKVQSNNSTNNNVVTKPKGSRRGKTQVLWTPDEIQYIINNVNKFNDISLDL